MAKRLKIQNLRAKVDTERLVDDFILMCIFVGNDFIPHVPSLEISEVSILLILLPVTLHLRMNLLILTIGHLVSVALQLLPQS